MARVKALCESQVLGIAALEILLVLPLLIPLCFQASDQPVAGMVLTRVREGVSMQSVRSSVLQTLPLGARCDIRQAFVTGAAKQRAHAQAGLDRIWIVEVPPGAERTVVSFLASDAASIEWAELNRMEGRLASGPNMPNDPGFDKQWSFHQDTGPDMNMPEAWGMQLGDPRIPIAVIDSGGWFPYKGSDHQKMTWENPNEIPGNFFDDDFNGFIDDFNGWDFVENDAIPQAELPHGIQTSGIIGADGDNGRDVVGVTRGCKVMHLRTFASDGGWPSSGPYVGELAGAAALIYAADSSAPVANNSWQNGKRPSPVINDAIAYAAAQELVMVFSAGNSDDTKTWPARHPDVIGVAAIDKFGVRSYWGTGAASGYGNWVDLAAGGTSIYTTYPPPHHVGYFFGTSAASPHVSGAAALLLSKQPKLGRRAIQEILELSAIDLDALNPGFEGLLGSGFVNVEAALLHIDEIADIGGRSATPTRPVPLLTAWQEGALGHYQFEVRKLVANEDFEIYWSHDRANIPMVGGILIAKNTHVIRGRADNDGKARFDIQFDPASVAGKPSRFVQVLAIGRRTGDNQALSNALRVNLE